MPCTSLYSYNNFHLHLASPRNLHPHTTSISTPIVTTKASPNPRLPRQTVHQPTHKLSLGEKITRLNSPRPSCLTVRLPKPEIWSAPTKVVVAGIAIAERGSIIVRQHSFSALSILPVFTLTSVFASCTCCKRCDEARKSHFWRMRTVFFFVG